MKPITALAQGLILKDGPTKACKAKIIPEPKLWPRNPPVRYRANIPTSWLEITLTEGRNRQVRRMTAAVGFPTLRLVRWAIGEHRLEQLAPGDYLSKEVASASYKPSKAKHKKPQQRYSNTKPPARKIQNSQQRRHKSAARPTAKR